MKMNNKDAASQYADLVNQPSLMDNMGDAFIEQGRNPALNGNQKMQNAMMSGFGHGMKGGANSARQEKLAWLEDQNKQIAMLDASLKMSLGKTAQRQADLTNIGADYLIDIKKISNMYGTGDYVGLNELTPLVYNDIAEKYPDLTKKYGKLHHVYGNNMFFEKGKEVKGYNIKDVFEPIIDTLPEEQRRELTPLMSLTARNKFEQSDLMQNLTIDKERANIDNIRSQTKQHNAQAGKLENEMNNPEKPYNKEVASHNLGYIKEQRERKINSEALVATLNDLEGFIKEANKKGQAGSDIRAIANRAQAKYWSGDNEEATLADMAKAAYFARVKEGGGSNPSTTEFLSVLETVPNIDKNPQAALTRLKFDREQALKQIYRFKKTEQGLRETNYQGSPDDEAVFKHNDDEYKTFSNQYYKPKIKVQAPDGTIALVSPEYADDLVNKKGGKVIDE